MCAHASLFWTQTSLSSIFGQDGKADMWICVQLLVNSFNASAAEGVMCRGTVSVGWDGRIYDCDFNQQLEMGVRSALLQL